jgi:hypothetical protein
MSETSSYFAQELKLDTLPTEILQRIASFCSYDSSTNLLLVNSTLRKACDDRWVFKHLINHANIQYNWMCDDIVKGISLESMKQVALADHWARNMHHGATANAITKWLPQLFAWQHPSIHSYDLTDLIRCFESGCSSFRSNTDGSQLECIAFCLATAILQRAHDADTIKSDAKSSPAALLYENGKDLRTALSEMIDANPQMLHRVYPWHIATIHAQIILVRLICYHILSSGPVRLSHLYRGFQPKIWPLPSRIPFRDLLDIPKPLQDDSATKFTTAHMERMTSAEFLQSGEWTGLYCYGSSTTQTITFDSPMCQIHFDVDGVREDQHSGGETVLLVTSRTGKDAVGPFTLSGEVSQSGAVRMYKSYTNSGFGWSWVARMTPYGIVGFWGSDISHQIGGCIWIWKKVWTRDFPSESESKEH